MYSFATNPAGKDKTSMTRIYATLPYKTAIQSFLVLKMVLPGYQNQECLDRKKGSLFHEGNSWCNIRLNVSNLLGPHFRYRSAHRCGHLQPPRDLPSTRERCDSTAQVDLSSGVSPRSWLRKAYGVPSFKKS